MSNKDKAPSILIIDDHILFAEGLRAIIRKITGAENIKIEQDPLGFLRKMSFSTPYDLIILDLQMPDISGLDVVRKIIETSEDARILVVSATLDMAVIRECIDRGAKGFVAKSSDSKIILEACVSVLNNILYIDPALPKLLSIDEKPVKGRQDIPPRTLEVLGQMAQGHSNKLIADLLNITEPTVKWHVTQLFTYLSVKNRTSCITKANQLGLIKLGE